MANVTLLGASYSNVPAVDLPQTGGGTVRFYEEGVGGILYITDLMDANGLIIRSIDTEDGTIVETLDENGGTILDITGAEVYLQARNVTPTESVQTITPQSGYDALASVRVEAIPSDYIGSAIEQMDSSDLTVSGATVTAPAGVYSSPASKSVASGTAGTPSATKGTVSNHSITITPSVTNTTGYITGGTVTGTGVSVSASELVSGSETVTSNDTYDVTNLAEIIVNVSGGGSVTVTDVANTTGTTCVITSGGSPTPSETWETIHEGNIGFYHDNNNDYPYCWVSALSSVTIATGSVWRITYSGSTYRCTAAYDNVLATACIGNPKWAQGSDDGSDVPFVFENLGYGAWMGNLNVPNTDAQYYFKIEQLVTE